MVSPCGRRCRGRKHWYFPVVRARASHLAPGAGYKRVTRRPSVSKIEVRIARRGFVRDGAATRDEAQGA
ncbi:MAG TPA: hypothetical protein VFS00_18310, partial [Polyangiaceae bacterium]|nr:hypothetical protein [Polyangiaceae bacterium]